jgi:hypothetical protein
MPNAAPKIDLDAFGLGKILKDFFVSVPLNQRDYAWDEENVGQLYDDFARALSGGEDHFVGSIVTIPKASNQLEVVDGQQRLATTALLLAAIRERLAAIDEPQLVESVNAYLRDIVRSTRERVPKLQLNVDDNQLFAQLLLDGTADPSVKYKRESHKKLIAAYRLAQDRVDAVLKAYAAKDHGDELNRWIDFIEQQAIAVLLRVPDDVNAFRMFETLNDRGLKVSQADLVKNHLYKTANGRLDETRTRWTQMRSILESLEDDDVPLMLFLRHAMIVMEGHVTEAAVFTKVQERAKTSNLVVALTARLEELANTYVATFNPEHEMWSGYPMSCRRAVEVFNLFRLKPLRPLIVAISRTMTSQETAESFRLLISLGVRLIIASSTRSASVEVPLSTAAKDVYDGKFTTAAEVRKALKDITPSDHVFRTEFARARVSNPKFARYYLRSLEQKAAGDTSPWLLPESDPEKITLEHVLPRVPDESWVGFDEDQLAEYIRRLGNMVLLTRQQNSDLKSGDFDSKRVVFLGAPYVLTDQVGRLTQWTAKEIEERQATLADLAVETWPIK